LPLLKFQPSFKGAAPFEDIMTTVW